MDDSGQAATTVLVHRIRSLTPSGQWDRGLGALLSAEDPNGLVSVVQQDGFGRLTAMLPPASQGCPSITHPGGESTGRPTVRISYELTPDGESQPLSRVITTTELSCQGAYGADGTSLVGIGYVDGLGRARVALSTGDTPGEWSRGGLTTLDRKGTVRRTYQPDTFVGSPTDFTAVLSYPVGIPYAVVRYDAFGRARGVIAEDASVTWTSHHALSSDACDPLDNDPSSPFYRTCTTARVDGHGRTIDQVLRQLDPDSGVREDHRLWSWHRVDGVVRTLVRAQADASLTRPATPAAVASITARAVQRDFLWDSVGRRIASDDPDTEHPSFAASTQYGFWRYLFNRAGDLVAVRDPRHCGQNFFYDLAGRLMGEQYVTCGEAQGSRAELGAESLVGMVGGGNSLGNAWSTANRVMDVRYFYDAYPSWASGMGLPAERSGVLGRATGVADRAQRSVVAYDDRGSGIWTARQVAVIPTPLTATTGIIAGSGGAPAAARPYGAEPSLATQPRGTVQYDTAHTYTQTAHFDHAGRGTSIVLPLDPDWGAGAPPHVVGTMAFQRRGLPASASVGVGCTVDAEGALSCPGGFQQPVIAGIEYTRDGLPSRVTYGDDGALSGASRAPTVSETRYDERRRPVRMFATRSPTSTTSGSLGSVSVPFDQQYAWDAASNLTDVFDHRDGDEWPAGYRPQSVHIRHDALYHVISADFDYTHEGGARSPVDASTDWRSSQATLRSLDPMQELPPSMVPAIAPNRVASLTWSWDFLGNNTDWTDDASSFYERSIGGGTLPSDPSSAARGIANGVDWDHQSGPLLRPSALYLATNLPTHAPSSFTSTEGGGGWVEVGYGVSGNVVNMTAHGQCVPRPAADSCLIGTNAGLDYSRRMRFYMDCQWSCAEEQHYEYRWDELNRIAEARRWDRDEALATTGPMYGWPAHPTVRQRYRYDGGNVRIVKETLDPETPGEDGGPRGRVALYVYPGDFERRGLERDVYSGTYVPLSDFEGRGRTETQYLVAGARVVWQHSFGTESLQDQDALANRRITVGIGDLLGTTSAVLDLVSGELVEASTYYPNGARETLRIPEGEPTLQAPYEPMGFTGKEADEEVGLVYFGERYLIPRIGRWASPDPLHIHASGGGEALNSYHYVSGNLLAARDPLGLQEGMFGGSDEQEQFGQRQFRSLLGPLFDSLDGRGPSISEVNRDRLWAGYRQLAARTSGVRAFAVGVRTEGAGVMLEAMSGYPRGVAFSHGLYQRDYLLRAPGFRAELDDGTRVQMHRFLQAAGAGRYLSGSAAMMTDAIRLIVGHEGAGGPRQSYSEQYLDGRRDEPVFPGAGDQAFRRAVEYVVALHQGHPDARIDFGHLDELLAPLYAMLDLEEPGISGPGPAGDGRTRQDMRLSVVGFAFGYMSRGDEVEGGFGSNDEAGAWLERNVAQSASDLGDYPTPSEQTE